jgi:hypothetical protein
MNGFLGYKNEKKVSNLNKGLLMKPNSHNEKKDGLQTLMCTIEDLT